jgi:hypothetical protein
VEFYTFNKNFQSSPNVQSWSSNDRGEHSKLDPEHSMSI